MDDMLLSHRHIGKHTHERGMLWIRENSPLIKLRQACLFLFLLGACSASAVSFCNHNTTLL